MTNVLYLTIAGAARHMKVSRQAVEQRISQGKLATVEIEGSTFVLMSGLTKWKQERSRRARRLMGVDP